MNNRARIVSGFQPQGEPTEAALKVLAEKLLKTGLEKKLDLNANPCAYSDEIEQAYKRVATLDFSSDRKTMSTVVMGGNSGN